MTEKTVPVTKEMQTPAITREESFYVAPPVDIYEEGEKLVVVADLPCAEQDSIKVGVENNVLTIQASTKFETKGEAAYREFDSIHFFRQFELSNEVDIPKIGAEFKKGVLTVDLPKVEKAKPRQIAVKVA
ncbi:MAG: Hsp20/alpha crystallin family protein [Candidatus Omnitrophota bacterium]